MINTVNATQKTRIARPSQFIRLSITKNHGLLQRRRDLSAHPNFLWENNNVMPNRVCIIKGVYETSHPPLVLPRYNIVASEYNICTYYSSGNVDTWWPRSFKSDFSQKPIHQSVLSRIFRIFIDMILWHNYSGAAVISWESRHFYKMSRSRGTTKFENTLRPFQQNLIFLIYDCGRYQSSTSKKQNVCDQTVFSYPHRQVFWKIVKVSGLHNCFNCIFSPARSTAQ